MHSSIARLAFASTCLNLDETIGLPRHPESERDIQIWMRQQDWEAIPVFQLTV